MKKKNSKIHFNKLLTRAKYIFLASSLFAFSLTALILFLKGVKLAENKVALSSGESSSNLSTGEVAGVEKKPSITVESGNLTSPKLDALSVLAEDLTTGQILYQKDIHKRLLPASTTKLMTALVAMDYFKLSDILTVTQDALVGGSEMGLALGEKLSFRSLLYGMMLNSGNDAAFAIASNYPGGTDNFVAAMNEKAKALGLINTHFQNPAGFDDPMQYSSAYDLAQIAVNLAKNPELLKVTSTKETIVYSLDSSKEHILKNLNKLLGESGVIGLKTGSTPEAGENLVGLVERGGHQVLTVVLASSDRFGETKTLMDWVFQNFSWKITD